MTEQLEKLIDILVVNEPTLMTNDFAKFKYARNRNQELGLNLQSWNGYHQNLLQHAQLFYWHHLNK